MLKQTRAAELRDYAKSLGWEVIAKRNGEERSLVCVRPRFKLRIVWDGTRLRLPMLYKEFDGDGQMVKSGQVSTVGEFRGYLELHAQVDKADNEILDFYRGKRIYWRNGLSGEIQDAYVAPYGKRYALKANKAGRKYLEFCDSEGFHAVFIDAIVRQRKAA